MRTKVIAMLALLSGIAFPSAAAGPVPLIYDTDMGNDVDDGFALGVIHALESRGECELLAVTVTKDHLLAGPFVDVLNTYYGRPDVPIGVVHNGPEPRQGKFLGLASERVDGAYRYPHDLETGNEAPEATALLRQVLAGQADHSVVIAQVGFSTNMARLLDTEPDSYSTLNGRDLVAQKVKVLSVMAGAFEPYNGKPHREYNVAMDVPAAQKLAAEWPTPIVYSGFEVGIKTRLPKEGIRDGFNYDPDHPMSAAYRLYNKGAFRDQPSWDLTSVLWGVRPDQDYFGLSPAGTVTYDDRGFTTWTEGEGGNHRYLTVNDAQVGPVKDTLTALTIEAPSTPGPRATLLHDDFSTYRKAMFSSVVGAHTEYHYLPESAPKGNWAVSTFRSNIESQRAWFVVDYEGEAAMAQRYTNKHTFYHPMLVTGDPVWKDYSITARMVPESGDQLRGIIFRYRNDRCYYILAIEGQRALLKSVHHATGFHEPSFRILDEKDLAWEPGDILEARIDVSGNRIDAEIGGVALSAEDDEYAQGRVAIAASAPTLFLDVHVETSGQEAKRIQKAINEREAEEEALQAANPKPVLWKRIDLKDFGVGRNLRFGDLDNDGQTDVLVVQPLHHGPKDRNSEVGCMTAMTFDGERLWQIGEADPWRNHLTNDVAVQIHDIDGDGENEVVYCKDLKIVIVNGATGEVERSIPTPKSPANSKKPYNKYERILGDSIFFCDLRGTGRDADFILKDRYMSAWAYDENLELLWHKQCNSGHYPYAYDVDGDDKDEVMIGYTLFDDDGTKLWTVENKVKDHADGIAIVRFRDDLEPRLLCAASDEGMFFADMEGNITKHHYLGHVQNPVIADFRPDLPGLEAISINFWANQGIVHFYNADNEVYHDFEPAQHGSMCLPVNWTGRPGEFWVLSPNVDEGGLFDGWGRRVVRFPADGHPDMCNAVLDITGDAREEIVVWDPSELWVYTQSDSPLPRCSWRKSPCPHYQYPLPRTSVP